MATLQDLIGKVPDNVELALLGPKPAREPRSAPPMPTTLKQALRPRYTARQRSLDALLIRIRVLARLALHQPERRMLRRMRRDARALMAEVKASNPYWSSKLAKSRAFGARIDAVDVPASLFGRVDIDRVIAIAAGLDPDGA